MVQVVSARRFVRVGEYVLQEWLLDARTCAGVGLNRASSSGSYLWFGLMCEAVQACFLTLWLLSRRWVVGSPPMRHSVLGVLEESSSRPCARWQTLVRQFVDIPSETANAYTSLSSLFQVPRCEAEKQPKPAGFLLGSRVVRWEAVLQPTRYIKKKAV